jgi:hypothetical protein
LALADYWQMNKKAKANLQKPYGENSETNLLLSLGYAARIYSQ